MSVKYDSRQDSKISKLQKANQSRQSHKNSICSSCTSPWVGHLENYTEENNEKVWIFYARNTKQQCAAETANNTLKNLVPFIGMKRRPSFSAFFSGRKSHTAPPASGSCLPSGAQVAASQSQARAGPGIENSTPQRIQ